jgi:hypothetical protein
MKFLIKLLLCIMMCFQWTESAAAVYYVAVDGKDDQSGTREFPLASIQKAQEFASPGDTVYIRGGEYLLTEENISRVHQNLFACITFLDKSGTPGNPIKYWAYPGEKPVFDHSAVLPANQRNVGIYVTADYIHIKGLDIKGIQVSITKHTESYCIYSWGNHNIFEELILHDGQGTGLRHRRGGNNLFLNCDAYNNHDYTSQDGRGGNTDGFGCHPHEGGTGNVFRGCRAWFNSDDGFDLIGAMESVVIENCWAMYAGYSTNFASLGDGNGFKAGGHATLSVDRLPDPIPRHTVKFCLAVGNKASGFYANHHIGGIDWYNNSAYRNRYNYNMLNRLPDNATDVPGYDHVLKNNLGYRGDTEVSNMDYTECDHSFNYFDLDLSVAYNDFLSLDEALLVRPREADGSLPEVDFMKLSSGSDLVDKGLDIGFPFYSKAPDLGAFELNYFAFPQSHALWYQFNYPENYGAEGNEPESMIFGLLDQDTLINGLEYNKVFRFYSEPPDPSSAVYIGAIREDDHQRVFYLGEHPFSYPVSDTGEIMIYDFSVNVGDTIREGLFTTNEYLLVSEIDSFQIGETLRKRIHFENYADTKWIEGMGNERGLLFYSGELLNNGLWGDLSCFYQDGTKLFHNQNYEYCGEETSNQISRVIHTPEIKIFPNPCSSGFVDIEVSFELKAIQLLNMGGQVIREFQRSNAYSHRIQTGTLEPGCYFLRLTNSRNEIFTRKLVLAIYK